MKIIELLKEFINESSNLRINSKWLLGDEGQFYVRKSYRKIQGQMCTVLDLANFEIYDKGKGTFTSLIKEICELNPWDYVFIENVHNERLADWLTRNFWIKLKDTFPGDYYKP